MLRTNLQKTSPSLHPLSWVVSSSVQVKHRHSLWCMISVSMQLTWVSMKILEQNLVTIFTRAQEVQVCYQVWSSISSLTCWICIWSQIKNLVLHSGTSRNRVHSIWTQGQCYGIQCKQSSSFKFLICGQMHNMHLDMLMQIICLSKCICICFIEHYSIKIRR